jgi:hypothetical protein
MSLAAIVLLQAGLVYYVYSNKVPVFKDDYISSFIYYRVDENIIKKYNILTINDYKIAILSKSADLIIVDNNNNAYLDFAEKEINDNYAKKFEYKNLIVFKKK